MYNTLKKHKRIAGFSLIELAIVVVIGGLLLIPAMSLYHGYQVDKDWQTTEDNISTTLNEIGDFRSLYARYPCPASPTAARGDNIYGHEEANCKDMAADTCSNGVCAYESEIAGQVVVVGTLPFKTMNLEESEAYDSRLSRLTYAVTAELTDTASFDLSGGGISVINDGDPALSMVAPADKAHFVVISHGHNKIGARTRSGIIGDACNNGSTSEKENCDADGTFMSVEINENFDDRIVFFSGVMPTEWQISNADESEIHLKSANSVAVGANTGTNLSAAMQGSVMNGGSIRSSESFYSATLCEQDATNAGDCFSPRLIAGSLDQNVGDVRFQADTSGGSGISCYSPADGEDGYLTGIQEGQKRCSDEIFVSCPSGSFINKIDGDGNVRCSSPPDPRCENETVGAYCGDGSRTLVDQASGGFRYLYYGECRMINNYNSIYFANEINDMDFDDVGELMDELEDLIDDLNDEDRTIGNCGGGGDSTSMVREAYKCTSGDWNRISRHEKYYPWWNYPDKYYNGGGWNAENSDTTTSREDGDRGHTSNNHDCWCREDYRAVQSDGCGTNMTGTPVRIQKFTCPQGDRHDWTTIRTDYSGCVCEPGTKINNMYCADYYDQLKGNAARTTPRSRFTGGSSAVKKTFAVSCSGNTPTTAPAPLTISAACSCTSQLQSITKSGCVDNKTNSWSWTNEAGNTVNEVGVATLSTKEWVCPGTSITDSFGNTIPDAGYWGAPTVVGGIPPCACDNNIAPSIQYVACPDGLNVDPLDRPHYIKEWDCSLNGGNGAWEAEDDWEFVAGTCRTCAWQSSGASENHDLPYGGPDHEVGNTCACGSAPANRCWAEGGSPEPYDVWNGCSCTVQVD